MGPTDIPLFALAVRCQDECAFARANQHPDLAHLLPPFECHLHEFPSTVFQLKNRQVRKAARKSRSAVRRVRAKLNLVLATAWASRALSTSYQIICNHKL